MGFDIFESRVSCNLYGKFIQELLKVLAYYCKGGFSGCTPLTLTISNIVNY